MTIARSGRKLPAQSLSFDPGSWSWRMSPTSHEPTLLDEWNLLGSPVTWPTSGSLSAGGSHWQARQELPVSEPGSSSLLPTPTSRDWKDGAPCRVPINSILGRTVWTLPVGFHLPPGDALLAEG